jgi:DNA-binding CsgD family transcriptional regulator
VLRDRRVECTALDQLIAAVRAGKSQALVLRGEPGVGKSALLDYLVERASGCQVARAAGVQSEMELAFAGLHQLCAPMLDRADRLPAPQREALRTALGISDQFPPDRFLVGLAVLSLLAEVAQERPLVCVVDDVQWLDSASAHALGFAARRLVAESVALVFAVRDPDEVQELLGLDQIVVVGLPDGDARELLGSVLGGPVEDRVLDRLVAETRGNPLALLELTSELTPSAFAGGFGLPGTGALEGRIEQSYRQRLAPLEPQTRRLLLVAAADPLGDPVLVWRAADRLGIGVEAAAPAIDAGLLEMGAQVRFRHPLVRSAVYHAASSEERRSAHRALAEATNPESDPDRRAWHAAQASAGPDEDVAAELERSAGRAQARGGLAAAASFLQLAAELTIDQGCRGGRMLAAAEARYRAGAPDAAQGLLALAEAHPLEEIQRARVDLLRAQIAFTANRGRQAPPLLLRAAKQLEPLDVRLARKTYLDTLSAAWLAGSLASGGGLREVAEAARAAPPSSQPPQATDLLLDGLAIRFTDGFAEAVPRLRRALRAFRRPDLPPDELRWLFPATRSARELWDDENWEALSDQLVEGARNAGALTVLPLALSTRILVHTFAGELTAATGLGEELVVATEAIGTPVVPYGAVSLAAWQGRETETFKLVEAITTEVLRRGEGIILNYLGWATALVCNSLGRYEDALAAAGQASETHPEKLGGPIWPLVELIEAAIRSGQREPAADALARLEKTTSASGTDWALGIEARSRALLSDGQAAETAYNEAIARLGRTRIRGELARAHLLYGEWLRRQNRRTDARNQLSTAHELFTTIGAEAFAQRAARELQAVGERLPKRAAEPTNELTPQEAQIARLVRDRLSNSEIAARLFISPRTVEWHLSRIYAKLNITSRRQL